MAKSVAIIQSNYIPWKGYFDVINLVDEFILLDEVQYTRRDWRNRNRIKTPGGLTWLSIPVQAKGRYHQRIDETLISDPGWGPRHLGTLRQAYGRSPHYDEVIAALAPLYESPPSDRLTDLNEAFLRAISGLLGISTPISRSTDYPSRGTKGERLVSLCEASGATQYLSGPAAREYMNEAEFAEAGVSVSYMDYSGYSEYAQPHGAFEHGVTVLDLLFCTGPDAPRYMKSFGIGANVAPQ